MKRTVSVLCMALLLGGWTAPASYTKDNLKEVCRVPLNWADAENKAGWLNRPLENLPEADGEGVYDLLDYDLTGLDLSGAGNILKNADFSTGTRWPRALPPDADPDAALEQGKDPGLGVRALHERGITGKGVGIGIIDQTLLADHAEYRDQLRYYNEHGRMRELDASMHGPAVASIAVGKTTGVAPDALLYFIADQHHTEYLADPKRTEGAGWRDMEDVSNRAKDIDEFIALNRMLAEDEKIRVISISNGWMAGEAGADKMEAAIGRARAAGIAVVWISADDPLMKQYFGMSREWMADPNGYAALRPATWIRDEVLAGEGAMDCLLTPMDGRTVAGPQGREAYSFYQNGGMSWVMPYVAGLYALAWQAKPGVSFAEFTKAARDTAHPAVWQYEGERHPFGMALDPPALIARLENRSGN